MSTTTTEQSTIRTGSRIVSIKFGAESRDELEVEWSTISTPTRSGTTVYLAHRDPNGPDIEIVAVDEDAAEDLLDKLSILHHVVGGGM